MAISEEALRERIANTKSLQSIVETMRTLAAVNIRRAEQAATASNEYLRCIHLALYVALGGQHGLGGRLGTVSPTEKMSSGPATVLVFASNQGLCGQFNDRIVAYAQRILQRETGRLADASVIAVGYRGIQRLEALGAKVLASFDAPNSVEDITGVVSSLHRSLMALQRHRPTRVVVVYNRPSKNMNFAETSHTLLPLDPARWKELPPGEPPFQTIAQTPVKGAELLSPLIRELLFIDLYRSLAESFAAENIARLASMEGASDNIKERLGGLEASYRVARQDGITNELMDIVTGSSAFERAT